MKTLTETQDGYAIPEAHAQGPMVLKFDSDKTPGEVYEYTIDSIEKAFKTIIALGNPDLARKGELRLKEFAAMLHNAGRRFSQDALERASFEELNAPKVETVKAWTIVDGKRIEGEVL